MKSRVVKSGVVKSQRAAVAAACLGWFFSAVDTVLPVDLHIKGCPPAPIALLEGLIALIEA